MGPGTVLFSTVPLALTVIPGAQQLPPKNVLNKQKGRREQTETQVTGHCYSLNQKSMKSSFLWGGKKRKTELSP